MTVQPQLLAHASQVKTKLAKVARGTATYLQISVHLPVASHNRFPGHHGEVTTPHVSHATPQSAAVTKRDQQ